MEFRIVSNYKPTGDQPEAITQLSDGIREGVKHQTLLGVTGSGKTFTIANVVEKIQRPTLVLSHNKTLAAQLYQEFKEFFPDNLVEYFVSYYDYYQPEAYLPVSDTYIEKDLAINDEIERLRLSATSALNSGRKDVLVVSSVSCLYGIGNPEDFHKNTIRLRVGQMISRNVLLRGLVASLYYRTYTDFKRGTFRVIGDTVDVFVAFGEIAYKFVFFGDEIEEITTFDPVSGKRIDIMDSAVIFPASIFMTTQDRLQSAIRNIQDDMVKQVEFFKKSGKPLEAKRIEERVNYDIEMLLELGHCSGIENYSRYFDGRAEGTRPFCLIDYFPGDFLLVIDESHVTIPQVRAMFGGDYSRKLNLVNFGFRLPAAFDNRPLKFNEFEAVINQAIYVSATPADYELNMSEGVVVEQIVRPTGLLDPIIEVKPTANQIDDLMEQINQRIIKDERILVTTLTKRMAEELTKYLTKLGTRCRYIHSDVDTLDRIEILDGLRRGTFDVLIGVNLLREGLDLPEVSLVAILDADKEGFLRNERSLTQTAGRAARNVNGRVIMYADKTTNSMQRTIDATNKRREKQLAYNIKHDITPKQIEKAFKDFIRKDHFENKEAAYLEPQALGVNFDPVVNKMSPEELRKSIEKVRKEMEKAAKDLDFIEAARLRDEMYILQKKMN